MLFRSDCNFIDDARVREYFPTASALLSGSTKEQLSNQIDSNNGRKCVYCNGTHKAENCTKFTSVENRIRVLLRARKCFNCFGRNHQASTCYSKKRCAKCKRKHHISVCKTNVDNKLEKKDDKEQKQESATLVVTGKDEEPTTHTGVFNVTKKKKTGIMMQTVVVTVTVNHNSYKARVIFHTGSHRSFIVKHLLVTLELKPVEKETLDISTFGSN